MLRNLAPMLALFGSFAIMCFGHGLQMILIPARATLESFPDFLIGAMMSGYYLGFISGSIACPWLIHRVGHIRVFAACSSVASVAMLLHLLWMSPYSWLILRILYGFCLVQLYMVMESWLNTVATNDQRGKTLSIYMIVNFLAMTVGQLLFFAAPADGFPLFTYSAIFLSLAITPLLLSRIAQPAPIERVESFSLKRLYATSPLAIWGAGSVGLVGGAYWGLAAVYVLKIGFDQATVAWFMTVSFIGGLAAQWPLGHLSDRINRRLVILLASLMILAASLGLTLLAAATHEAPTPLHYAWLMSCGILFGAGFHPLYSLCIAHANDFLQPQHFIRASAGLQQVQSIGAMLGPLLGGLLMQVTAPAMLFGYAAFLMAIFSGYNLLRIVENRIAPLPKPFRLLTRTGPQAFQLDPRAETGETPTAHPPAVPNAASS